MADVLGMNIPINVPKLGLGGEGGLSGTIWVLIVLIIFILIIGAVAIFLMKKYKTYNKKINVFENIAGRGYQPVYKDRARLVRLGDGGEELLYLLKKKVYRAAYGKKMGKNNYWFAIGQDGYWYNVILGDVDAKIGMLDIEPIDRDMRYMHVAIRKNIESRYKKQSVMEKYGTWIMGGTMLIIMIIGIWFILDKIADIAAANAGAVEAAVAVQEETKKIIVSLDNILSSRGGILDG